MNIIRKEIYNIIVSSKKKFSLREIYNLYDEIAFDHQISNRLKKLSSSLIFTNSIRKKGYPSIIISTKDGDDIIYSINISLHTDYSKNKDRISMTQKIIEYCILVLSVELWSDPDDDKNKFYRCLCKNVFAYKKCEVNDIVKYTSLIKKSEHNIGLLKNVNMSCYMDSLIYAMFISTSSFYRNEILSTSINSKSIKMKDYISLKNECSDINTKDDLKNYITKVQNQLKEIYKYILSNKKERSCTPLRKTLSRCLEEVGSSEQYNVSEVYSLLTDIFPQLKIHYEYKLSSKKKINYATHALFQMWDFVDPETKYKNIMWNKINSEVLVFQNGLIPFVKNYGSSSPEKMKVGEDEFVINKKRSFSEYILKNRYRLFAVIQHLGKGPSVKENKKTSSHYILYFRLFNKIDHDTDEWYVYDDIDPSLEKTENGKLPNDIFLSQAHKRPELLFYEKMGEIDNGDYSIKIVNRPDGYSYVMVTITMRDSSPSFKKIEGRIKNFTPSYMSEMDKAYVWRVETDGSEELVELIRKNI